MGDAPVQRTFLSTTMLSTNHNARLARPSYRTSVKTTQLVYTKNDLHPLRQTLLQEVHIRLTSRCAT